MVNGLAIYCVPVRRLPGVGAASPDGGVCNFARARYYKHTSCPVGPGFCACAKFDVGLKMITRERQKK